MKLYDVPRNSRVRLLKDTVVPPCGVTEEAGTELDFCHIDGMYSLCYNDDGDTVHPAACTDVEVLTDE